jgi:neutral trehalase
MDNSPRFDRAARLDAVDFSALLASECEALARIARSLRKRKEADAWSAEHERIRAAINRLMWSEEQAFYLDVDVETGRRSPVLASSGFLPLVCGAPDREQATRLIAHLRDPAMFGTPLPVASVAAADTEHYSKDMWRGPVWMNVNWLIAAGLDRYGRQDLACEIRAKSIREIEKHALLYGTCFEFFDDRREVDPPQLLRKGRCAPDISPYHQAFFDYGWTATCYTDWVYTADDDDDDASA